jgi:hypothetical protein
MRILAVGFHELLAWAFAARFRPFSSTSRGSSRTTNTSCRNSSCSGRPSGPSYRPTQARRGCRHRRGSRAVGFERASVGSGDRRVARSRRARDAYSSTRGATRVRRAGGSHARGTGGSPSSAGTRSLSCVGRAPTGTQSAGARANRAGRIGGYASWASADRTIRIHKTAHVCPSACCGCS